MEIRFSIITPSFNQASYLGRTLQSVSGQSCRYPVEQIVVDGGSNDGTMGILQAAGPRVRWISEPDGGQSDAFNKGVALSTGTLIGWLNSDDLYLPGTLQRVGEAFEASPDKDWLYGKGIIIGPDDREIRSLVTRYKNFRSSRFSRTRLLTENYISQPSVFIRKEALVRTGLLDPTLHYAMDYDLWLRLSTLSDPIVLPGILSAFRIHPRSKSHLRYRDLFAEQYAIHLRYDRASFRLFLHRARIALFKSVYRLIN